MGPVFAAKGFSSDNPQADRFRVTLLGSLAKTGRGHGTDRAITDVLSPIPVEVIFGTGDEQGLDLSKLYRETSEGGLAKLYTHTD